MKNTYIVYERLYLKDIKSIISPTSALGVQDQVYMKRIGFLHIPY